MSDTPKPPESNVTGHDYSQRGHLHYKATPIIDFHSHVTMTAPSDQANGPAGGSGAEGTTAGAETMLALGREFGISQTVTMCPAQDIAPLRAKFGDALLFNGMINKKPDEPDDVAYALLDRFLEEGVHIIKLWSAPRGRERGLTVDAPWRVECLRRASRAGLRNVMVHVGDPDAWWEHTYTDTAKFGTKPEQYVPFQRLMKEFPEFNWIGAHMGGDPEHPDHLQAMLEEFPQLYFDTSATKWQVREVSPRTREIYGLVCRFPGRFLFGTDLVTRHGLTAEHYVSRYWCQRTLWESDWSGPSPVADSDYKHPNTANETPTLRGVNLPEDVLRKVYFENARRLLEPATAGN
ncbi:amidohydrolase family protein [Zavarzinella formosa]|uniref:amidohydrolase family protein n=1 Tax=Zavarzinella formosa TaxID=360055 RepID=UPI0002E14194|nr:amidohydrolase family protein [Zavarzinella formosa]